MEQKIFQDEPLKDRHLSLEANCDKVIEEYTYSRHMNGKELAILERNYVDISKQLYELEVKKKEIMADYAAKIKPVKVKSTEMIESIKHNRIEETDRCYQMIDYDSGEVGVYNSHGELVAMRLATPDETRQRSIVAELRKEATND